MAQEEHPTGLDMTEDTNVKKGLNVYYQNVRSLNNKLSLQYWSVNLSTSCNYVHGDLAETVHQGC